MPPLPETTARTVRPVAERTPTPDDSDPIFHMAPQDNSDNRVRQPMRHGTRRPQEEGMATSSDDELPNEIVVDTQQ